MINPSWFFQEGFFVYASFFFKREFKNLVGKYGLNHIVKSKTANFIRFVVE